MSKQFRTKHQQNADDIMELLESLQKENFKIKVDYKILSQNFTSTVLILDSIVNTLVEKKIISEVEIKKAYTKMNKKYKRESVKKSKEISKEYENMYLDSLLNSDIHANS